MRIAGLQRSSLIDYPEKISAVVFTQGCNMNCSYCHNSRLIRDYDNCNFYDESEVLEFLNKRRGLLDGVVITGGEPTLQKDLVDFIIQVREMGFLVKLDTNGTNPSVLKKLIDDNLVDYVAMDIKAPMAKYRQICCSEVDTGKIEESIDILLDGKVEYEFRTTYAPELEEVDLIDISRFIKGAGRYVIQQYREVNPEDGTYTGSVNKRNILSEITSEIQKYVELLKFRGNFGII
ncbi:MAG: anaerobic ribonucleoside-triphosphate reductase activating protein [Clostridiaceae bacterium]|nr:anaerobic ribonucleoside-triphosphate reductase activating protein [Clostridiaceae bacterium]